MAIFTSLLLVLLLPLQVISHTSSVPPLPQARDTRTCSNVDDKAMAGPVEAPVPGYDVVDLTWEVEVFPGRFEKLTGTVEKIHRAARAINPDWRPRGVTGPEPEPESVGKHLAKRYTWTSTICGPGTLGWHPCKVRRIEEGIAYLRGLPGSPANGPGPGACGRISCSYQASIWWCNDAPWAQSLDSWNDIADSVQLMVWKCATGNGYADRYMTGQIFTSNKWNVIVRQESRESC